MTTGRQDLISAIGSATQAYQRATDGFDDAVGRALGLNPTDLRCLDWLTEGPMTAGKLGEATGLSSAATTTLLDRLERKGFVHRERDTVDRRKVLVELTTRAREMIGGLYGPLAQEGSQHLARFSDDELERLREFLLEATEVVDRHTSRIRGARVAGRTKRPGGRSLSGRVGSWPRTGSARSPTSHVK
jgi:DNA-binding MarR family transcriptional regulator